MRDFPEIADTAIDQPAFSSRGALLAWKDKWCRRCQHPAEVAWRTRNASNPPHPDFPAGCTILEVTTSTQTTPTELQPDGRDRYRCSEFRGLRIVGGDA